MQHPAASARGCSGRCSPVRGEAAAQGWNIDQEAGDELVADEYGDAQALRGKSVMGEAPVVHAVGS
jgi:hypothetical protein